MQKYGQDFFVYKYILNKETQKYIDNFDSGKPDIDEYFKKEALNDINSVTYIYVDTSTDTAVAVATLSCTSIPILDKNDVIESTIPAIEIKYFALSTNVHHISYMRGSSIKLSHYILCTLVEHLEKIATESVGAAKIVLQAMPDAINFYSKCKFRKLIPFVAENVVGENDGCVPMFYNLHESVEVCV